MTPDSVDHGTAKDLRLVVLGGEARVTYISSCGCRSEVRDLSFVFLRGWGATAGQRGRTRVRVNIQSCWSY